MTSGTKVTSRTGKQQWAAEKIYKVRKILKAAFFLSVLTFVEVILLAKEKVNNISGKTKSYLSRIL